MGHVEYAVNSGTLRTTEGRRWLTNGLSLIANLEILEIRR